MKCFVCFNGMFFFILIVLCYRLRYDFFKLKFKFLLKILKYKYINIIINVCYLLWLFVSYEVCYMILLFSGILL